MNELLLFLHCVGFAITIGAALYDRCYIVRNLHRAKGSPLEAYLLSIYLSTGPLFSVGVALILVSGVGLTLLHGDGFFQRSAVGLKQALFLVIGLAFPLYILPIMAKIYRLLNTTSDFSTGVPEQCRFLLKRLSVALDAVTLTNIVILAIAIWKPNFIV